jgi:hypothetical protein
MTKRYLNHPQQGRIKEGRIYYGMLGRGFSSKTFFSNDSIATIGISADKETFELQVIEGKFSYKGGKASGVVAEVNILSSFKSYDELGGQGWKYIPSGKAESLDKFFTAVAAQSESFLRDVTRVGLSKVSLRDGLNAARTDITPQITQQFGRGFASKHARVFEKWLINPSSFNIGDISELNSKVGRGNVNIDRELIATLLQPHASKSEIDPITNFNPKTQKIRIDSDPFGIGGDYEVDYKVAKSAKQLKKLQKSDFNLIYNRKDGSLYYNVNREEAGFGARGGLIAVLDPKLPLTGANFEIF